MWKCHHELDVKSRQFVFDVDASHRVTRAQRRLATEISFQTPTDIASWLQNLNANIDYEHDMHAWKSSGRTNFQWGRYAFGHEHDVDIQPNTALVTTAKLNTPFTGFEQVGLGLNNRRSGNSWRANNELLLGRVGKVTLDGSLNYNGYNFNSMLRVTTPVRNLERIVVNVRNAQQQDGIWASHADIQYAPSKIMTFDNKLSLGTQKMIEFEASTPCPYLRMMKYKASYSGTLRSFQANTELQHNKLGRDKITALVSVDTNNVRNMNGQLVIRAPFEDFRSLRVTGRHVQDSYDHMTTTVAWQINRYRGSVLRDVTSKSWVDFDSRIELEYLNDRKIELTSSLRLDPNIVLTTSFRSPFEHARQIDFSFKQEGPLDNFKVVSELSYDTRKKITTDIEFLLRDESLRSSVRLTTPFTALNRFAFDVNLSGRPSQFNLESTLEFNDRKIAKTLEFQLHRSNLRMSGSMETPFRQLRSLTYTATHNGDWSNFRNNFAVTYNGQDITASSEFLQRGSNMKLELRTPWQAVRSYSFQHANKPGSSFAGWSNSWTAEFNGQKYTGESECDWNGNQLNAHFVWNVPEEYSVRITHTNSANHLSNNIVVKLAGNQITEALEYRRTPDKIEVMLNLASTYRGYERMEAVFKHERSDRGFTTNAEISTPFRVFPRLTTELFYQGSANQVASQFKAQLPFRSLRRLILSLNHQGDSSEFTSVLRKTINDKTVVSTLTFKNRPRSLESSLSVQTPFDGYERFNAAVAFNGQPQQFTASSTVQLPFDGVERLHAELTHNGNWKNFRASGKFESSIENLRSVNFNVQHSAVSWAQINTRASVVVPDGTYSMHVEHELRDSLKTTVSVQTPVRGYEKFGMELAKSGDIRNLQLKTELTTSIRRWERATLNWSHNLANKRSINLRGSLETSFSPYQRMALTFTHSAVPGTVTTNAVVETSIPGYTKFTATSECSSAQRMKKWSGSVETPIRGYERWTAGVEHGQNGNGKGFRTVVRTTTPINNYNNFAATLSYAEQSSQFTTQLRLNTPFLSVPQIDITLAQRGNRLSDFTTSLSVDYAGKKIELEMAFKMGLVQPTQRSYEASFKLTSPCPIVRDFSVTASHQRRPERTAGALEVIFNGEKKVCTVIIVS